MTQEQQVLEFLSKVKPFEWVKVTNHAQVIADIFGTLTIRAFLKNKDETVCYFLAKAVKERTLQLDVSGKKLYTAFSEGIHIEIYLDDATLSKVLTFLKAI